MTEFDIVSQWIEKARDDLTVAEHVFNELNPKQIEISCYHCQQAAEKVLKGFLLHHQKEVPKSHNLVMLCQMCIEVNDSFINVMERCIDLTPYSITTRYPNEIEITEAEAAYAIIKAREVCNFVIACMPEHG